MKVKDALFGRKAMTNLNGILKSTDITLLTKIHIVKAMVFPVVTYGCESGAERQRHYFANKACSSQSYSWKLSSKELMLLNCGVGEDSWEEIHPLHPKGNHSWKFIGRTDVKAETPILSAPDAKNLLFGKDPDAGKDWRQKKGMTEDEMVRWHHHLDGHEFE